MGKKVNPKRLEIVSSEYLKGTPQLCASLARTYAKVTKVAYVKINLWLSFIMTGQARISGTELKCLQYSYNLDYLPLDSGLFAGRFAANVFAYSLCRFTWNVSFFALNQRTFLFKLQIYKRKLHALNINRFKKIYFFPSFRQISRPQIGSGNMKYGTKQDECQPQSWSVHTGAKDKCQSIWQYKLSSEDGASVAG